MTLGVLLLAFATGSAIERVSAQTTPGAKKPEAQKPETKLSPEEKRQLAHQETLEAWKNKERLRAEYEHLLLPGSGEKTMEAERLKEAERYNKKQELEKAEIELLNKINAETNQAPEVIKLAAEFHERAEDVEEAKRNKTIPESYRKEAAQRLGEAHLRYIKAENKEFKRIKNDLEAGQKSIPAPVTPPPSGKISLELGEGGHLGLSLNAFSGFYIEGFGTVARIDQHTTELSVPFDEVTDRFHNPATSGGGGVSIGYTYTLPSNPTIGIGCVHEFEILDGTNRERFPGGTFVGTRSDWNIKDLAKLSLFPTPDFSLYGVAGLAIVHQRLQIDFGEPPPPVRLT